MHIKEQNYQAKIILNASYILFYILFVVSSWMPGVSKNWKVTNHIPHICRRLTCKGKYKVYPSTYKH